MIALPCVFLAFEFNEIPRKIEIIVKITFYANFDVWITAQNRTDGTGGHVAETKGDKMFRTVFSACAQCAPNVCIFSRRDRIIEIVLSIPATFDQKAAAGFRVRVFRILPHDFDPRGIVADTIGALFIIFCKFV